jgi:hypothetical protein
MVSPHHIKYAGIASDELNMIDLIMCVALESDNGETNTYLNRSAIQSESYDGRYKPTARYKYDEVFAPKFTFMKKNFGNFSMDEVRLLLKYLTSKDTTAFLEVFYDDSNVVSWAAIGGWTEINLQKLANNRTIGVTAVFSAITPYALSDLHTVTKAISSPTDNKIIIDIDTDDNKPVYPKITINHGYNGTPHTLVRIPNDVELSTTSDMIENTVYYNDAAYYWKSTKSSKCVGLKSPGYSDWTVVPVDRPPTDADTWEDKTIYRDISEGGKYYWIDPYYFKKSVEDPKLATTGAKLTNNHTDFLNIPTVPAPITIVKNNNSTEKIVLDGANKIISSTSVNRVFDSDFNLTWLPLFDGHNEITVEGNCEVTISWREPRKVGEY